MARSGRRRSTRRVDEHDLARRFGAAVARARREKGQTQEQLAESLGISVSHVSLLERGGRMPSLPMCVNVANALGLSLDAALGRAHAKRDELLVAAARLTPSMRAHLTEMMQALAKDTDVTPPPARRRRRRAKG